MIYPDVKSYERAFPESDNDNLGLSQLGDQQVLGIYMTEQIDSMVSNLLNVVSSLFQSSHLEIPEKQASMEI